MLKKEYIIFLLFIFINCSINNFRNENDIKPISIEDLSSMKSLGNGWYRVTEFCEIVNLTPRQAKQKAINQACRKAIEYHSGVEIKSRVYDTYIENNQKIIQNDFLSILSQVSNGVIIKKDILDEKRIVNGNKIFEKITLKLKVGTQKGKKDTGFILSGKINNSIFRNGECIEIEAKSSKNCYISIFNICSNDSVYLLFPNHIRENNYIVANKPFQFPNTEDNIKGLNLPVSLLPNRNEDYEIIKIIVTKKMIDLNNFYKKSRYNSYKTARSIFIKELLKIPRNEIEELDIDYKIIR